MRSPGVVVLLPVALWVALTTVGPASGLDIKQAVNTVRTMLPMVCYMNEKSAEDVECSGCISAIRQLLGAVVEAEEWAILMLDAFVKPPPGIFGGGFTFVSDYDACFKVPPVNATKTETSFKLLNVTVLEPRYCSIKLSVSQLPEDNSSHHEGPHTGMMALLDKEKENLRDVSELLDEFPGFLGLCLPSPCTKKSVQTVFKSLGYGLSQFLKKPPNVKLGLDVVDCVTKAETKRREATPTVLAALIIAGILAVLVVFGTLIDTILLLVEDRGPASKEIAKLHAYEVRSPRPTCEVLRSFSAYRNMRMLMRGRHPKGTLKPLAGISSLSFIWILLGNTLQLRAYNLTMNLKELKHVLDLHVVQFAVNSSLAVDALMTVLAMAITYAVVGQLRRKFGPDNCSITSYLRSFWSASKWFILGVIPAYMLLLLTLNAVFPAFSSGPTWPMESRKFLSQCPDYWIWNVVFVNNFYPTNQQCMPHTWLMAYVTQAILFAAAITFFLVRYPKITLVTLGACIFGCMLTTFLVNLWHNLGPTTLLREYRLGSREEYHDKIASNLYTRGAPFCIGIIAGYIQSVNPRQATNKWQRLAGWAVSLTLLLGTINGTYRWNKGPIPPGGIDYAAYDAFHRFLFAVGLSIMAVACCRGHGGVINVFLSWPGWLLISKLGFLFYILHPFIIFFSNGTTKAPLYQSVKLVIEELLWNLLATIVICIPCHLLFEAPFLRLTEFFTTENHREDDSPTGSGDIRLHEKMSSAHR